MKKILIPAALIIIVIVFLVYSKKNPQETISTDSGKKSSPIAIKTIADSATLKENLVLPGIVSGINEATITAKSGGSITALNFDLGRTVASGQLLAKIDDTGNNLETGKNDLQSANVQQLEKARSLAKKSLELAEKNYKKDTNIANRTARDIAKLQLQNAEIALQSALDNHLITAPISGKIIAKNVSLGDSVAPGQTLAIISKSDQVKIQFFVDQAQYPYFSIGMFLDLTDNNQNIFKAKVSNISPQADNATKKFLIEAIPTEKNSLLSGTVVDVSLVIEKHTSENNNIFIPLSAITIGQNENYLFIVEDGKAKKTTTSIKNIFGEIGEINLNLPKETQIIVSGNKSLQNGDAIEIKND
ncbi:MAG: efflux RND transporter periplasmic adaptor subunit [Candidatus Moraniibacteriota bacterium]